MFPDIHTLVYSPSTLTLSLDICLTFRQWNISKQYQQRLVSACTLVLDFSKCFHLHSYEEPQDGRTNKEKISHPVNAAVAAEAPDKGVKPS